MLDLTPEEKALLGKIVLQIIGKVFVAAGCIVLLVGVILSMKGG